MKIIISEDQLEAIKFKLKESPDDVSVNGFSKAIWTNSDAIAFGFYGGRAYVSFNYEKFLTSNNFNDKTKKEFKYLSDNFRRNLMGKHDSISYFYEYYLDEGGVQDDRNKFAYPGRIWFNSKIISFWLYPDKNKLKELLEQLSEEIHRVYGGDKINFSDYKIEVKSIDYPGDLDIDDEDYVDDVRWLYSDIEGDLIPISEFIGSENSSAEEMSKMHLLPSDKKKETSQMKAATNAGEKYLSRKFNGDVSQAEWNAARNKSMGESIEMQEDINIPVSTGDTVLMGKFKNKRTLVKSIGKDEYNMPTINGKKAATFRMTNTVTEATESDVNLDSFEIKKELNNKFWIGKKLNLKVRKRLLKLSDDFLEFINVDSKYCKDVLFLGSLANYNWSKYSDVDLHLIVDFKKINKDVELVRDYFDSKRKIWGDEHSSLKIYGFPVEIYIQDVDESNASTAEFSLEKNKWNKFPNETQEEIFDSNKVKQKAADVMTKIDKLKSKCDKKPSVLELENISKEVKSLFDNIKKLRKSGLDSKLGEFSIGNIVFKVLRRSGHMGILVDLKRDTYDKINTIK